MRGPPTNAIDPGDLGHRLLQRRNELRLTVEEVARRAGMATDYLNWVEQTPTAEPSTGSLIRLSVALDLPKWQLLGGGQDRAPGRRDAGEEPVLLDLDDRLCADLLRDGGIGRLVFLDSGVPTALPVNFKTHEGNIAILSTESGSISQIAPDDEVSFEVDQIDEAMSLGWSVLATGTIHRVRDPSTLVQLSVLGIEPWTGGERPAYFSLEVNRLTGRRIRQRRVGSTL